MPRVLSPAGVDLISRFEGFSATLYNDPAGHCTIGFGHLVHRGPTNGSEPEEFKAGISRQRALELLHQDAQQAVSAIERLVAVPMSQPQLDALASFVFNVGVGAFAESTLLKVLNAGHYDRAPNELGRWVHADGKVLPGLVRRRAAEAAMFAGESLPVQAPPWPGTYLRCPPPTRGEDVRRWQRQMAHRGWSISDDGTYGPKSSDVCKRFQRDKGLPVDGVVGPTTWDAAWAAPVT